MVSLDSFQKYVGDTIIFDVWLRIFDSNDTLAAFLDAPTPLAARTYRSCYVTSALKEGKKFACVGWVRVSVRIELATRNLEFPARQSISATQLPETVASKCPSLTKGTNSATGSYQTRPRLKYASQTSNSRAPANTGPKKAKKKWSKGKVKDKAQHADLLDEATSDKLYKDVQTYRLITVAVLVDRMKINGSVARRCLADLEEKGIIKKVVSHSALSIYTRAITADE
ncbi:hypothetical protein VE04_04350 [Pseudogymnoascus sp. 24MN13]|nr:hypothetical protein VE04_04350 [Pseudogymnoascus sp. 24MN13]